MIRSKLTLAGTTVLVTGGASGIGAAGARILVARGARVALVDLDESGLRAMVDELGADHARAFLGSVTDRARLNEIVADVLAWTGRLDVCWANAGIAAEPPATIATIDEAIFERVVEIDLLGVWRTVRACLPAVTDASGHFLLTASTYAFANGAVNAPYAAAKSAVESFGRSLRGELAGTGTTAGVLYPGWIETPIVQTSRHVDPVAMQLTAIGFPGPLGRLIPAPDLAEAAVRGIERRSARVIHPQPWPIYSWLRGIVNPLIDAIFDRHRTVHRLIRQIESQRRAEQER
jgi:NAD(P)-dependent dehydrogenase (short-subunit alcohol dehydrogenase family)